MSHHISAELSEFYRRWMSKANHYKIDGEVGAGTYQDVGRCYDKFFTLYTLYNRLFRIIPTFKGISTNQQEETLATQNVVTVIGEETFMRGIKRHQTELDSIISFIEPLIKEKELFIHIKNKITLEPDWEEDEKLLKRLKNRSNKNVQSKAILTLIYKIRCNLFHGVKAIVPAQYDLMKPIIIIFQEVVEMLHNALEQQR